MKNVILLLLFILALSSCTIEKRRYFKGYHVENGKTGPFDRLRDRGNGEMGKRESAQEQQCAESEAQKPQRGEIIIEGDIKIASEIVIEGDNITANDISIAGDTARINEVQKTHQNDFIITLPLDITDAHAKAQLQNTTQSLKQHKSHALEGLGTIFLVGIITLVVIVALLLFILTDSAVFAVIGSLFLGLFMAIGVYLLLMILFFSLLFLIISSFGS